MRERPPCEPFGPVYPALDGVERHRRKARAAGSVAAMAPEDRRAYGLAVLDALRRANLPKPKPHPCPCASGLWDADGATILRKMKR